MGAERRAGAGARFSTTDYAENGCVFCFDFFAWHHDGQRHRGIGRITPDANHHGSWPSPPTAPRVLATAWAATTERVVRRPRQPTALPLSERPGFASMATSGVADAQLRFRPAPRPVGCAAWRPTSTRSCAPGSTR
jgi:hypothetical protein